MKVFILAGGYGERLYPISNENNPKQLLKIRSDKSMLVNTIDRFLHSSDSSDIHILTSKALYANIAKEIMENFKNNKLLSNIIVENESKNTLPAVVNAVKKLNMQGKMKLDDRFFITPSDIIIDDDNESFNLFLSICKNTKESILFGTKPDRLSKEYGYIEIDESKDKLDVYHKMKSFHEKPDMEKAVEYIEKGFLWNCGMYCFTCSTFLDLVKIHTPDIYNIYNLDYQDFLDEFKKLDSISIDKGITEKNDDFHVFDLSKSKIRWNDIGSIVSFVKEVEGWNYINGDVNVNNCDNYYINIPNKKINFCGFENIIVVECDNQIKCIQKEKYVL